MYSALSCLPVSLVTVAFASFVLLQICLDGAKSQMVIAIRRAPQMLDGHEDKRSPPRFGWSKTTKTTTKWTLKQKVNFPASSPRLLRRVRDSFYKEKKMSTRLKR